MADVEVEGVEAEGVAALAAFERALAAGPHGGGDDYTEATRHLCALRELLIAGGRAGAAGSGVLEEVNSLISCSLAGHFPIGTVPTAMIEGARDMLRALLPRLSVTAAAQATRS